MRENTELDQKPGKILQLKRKNSYSFKYIRYTEELGNITHRAI
jgi:hypothetical protein